MVFDGHSDLLYDVTRRRLAGETHVLERRHRDRLAKGGVEGLVLALWTSGGEGTFWEGLSGYDTYEARVEAMLLGMPGGTTDYPGAEEVMRDGVTGLIVPRGDGNALARKLILLARDRETGSTLGRNARRDAEEYRTENVIRLWRKVIEE